MSINLIGVVCPKCGCRPLYVLTRRLVKEAISVAKDGEVSSLGFKLIPLTKKERMKSETSDDPLTLECGLGHKWTHDESKASPERKPISILTPKG